MKYVKGWDEEEDDYALFGCPTNKKGHKNSLREVVAIVESLDIKQQIALTRKVARKRVQRVKLKKRKHKRLKGTIKERERLICPKFDAFAWDCPKPCENDNIAQENEQNRNLTEMTDLGDNSVCEEFAMICTDIYSENKDEEIVVFLDQRISSTKYKEATYGELMNTDSDDERNVNYNVALICAKDIVSLEKKQRRLNRDIPSENAHNISQRHNEINETDRKMVINKETNTVQGPISNDKENESQKAWTMEMPMMDGDISTTEADEKEQIEESNKKFQYRAVHSHHIIQQHMQQILEHQRVVDEYRSMANEEKEMIPLESNLYKTDPVINQHIIQMIDMDIFSYERTFGSILMELRKI